MDKKIGFLVRAIKRRQGRTYRASAAISKLSMIKPIKEGLSSSNLESLTLYKFVQTGPKTSNFRRVKKWPNQ